MKTTSSQGYFAVVTGMTGTVEFRLTEANLWTNNGHDNILRCLGAAIIYDFSIEYQPVYSIVANDTSSNVYRQVITLNGFTDKKQLDLNIGTMNNNHDSASFVRTSAKGEYLEELTYRTSSGTYNQRPEIHLVNRMARYYSKMRRAISATVKSGLDLFKHLYTYNGRTFFGIDASHNWRDDEQQVKFMEVTNE